MQSGELSSLQAPQTCPSHISPQSCKIRREALGFLLIHCDGVSFEGSQELFHVLNTNSGFFLNIISDCGNKTCIAWSRGWAYSLQSFEIYTRIICTQNLLKSGGQRYCPQKLQKPKWGLESTVQWDPSHPLGLWAQAAQAQRRGTLHRSLGLVMKCSQLAVFTLFLQKKRARFMQ